jgi:hypothetical protein
MIDENKLKEAVEYFEKNVKAMVDFIKAYLSVSDKMPEKRKAKECECDPWFGCGCSVDDYNEAIDECTLAVSKMIPSVEEIENYIVDFYNSNETMVFNPYELAKALHDRMTGGGQ